MAVSPVPEPSTRDLLPSLLACLSTASVSDVPPPALLPLLSPILRQRVQLLASDDWLSLLCWDAQASTKLPRIVGNIHVEPHPSSGEIEVEDPDQILYRRSDPETLHARLVLGEYGIAPTYLWCTGGERGSGAWELAELRGLADIEDGTEWFGSIEEANEAGFRRKAIKTNGTTDHSAANHVQHEPESKKEEDDDDAYWAAYDRTPSGTPAQKSSPAPQQRSRVQVGPTQTELEYFARYASEVQPAMDPHDPDEEAAAGATAGESTLNGNSFSLDRRNPTLDTTQTQDVTSERHDSARDEKTELIQDDDFAGLNHPRPASSASSSSVEKLEREAVSCSQAELAIKQHISTDFKSLFRLARATGIEREEFERLIKRELEVLPLLEQDN